MLIFCLSTLTMTQQTSPKQLDMLDTIIPSDLPRFIAFVEKEQYPNTYSSYILNDAGNVEFRVHNGDTDDIVEKQEFGDNGMARVFMEQQERWFEEMKERGVWVAPEEGEGEGK
ncbi:hypothetical protein D6D22_07122 [Aureobasidium pullulans]|uniref:Uncharacterized protein n=1 Tax=Aureobasidium pullulans TaxID=5580 RepID=A0A4S8XJ55_AURPU|nr:hypothetical protein D6D22_07122 [Aureobasidium pullulans]